MGFTLRTWSRWVLGRSNRNGTFSTPVTRRGTIGRGVVCTSVRTSAHLVVYGCRTRIGDIAIEPGAVLDLLSQPARLSHRNAWPSVHTFPRRARISIRAVARRRPAE